MNAETTVTVKGQAYLVRRIGPDAHEVFAIVTRNPVNPRGFYQTETVYRRVKVDGAKGRAAIKAALGS